MEEKEIIYINNDRYMMIERIQFENKCFLLVDRLDNDNNPLMNFKFIEEIVDDDLIDYSIIEDEEKIKMVADLFRI
jgi:hypothetical protein